jgi:hypothetical protein
MWIVAVLLVISFALFLSARITKTRRTLSVSSWLGGAASSAAVFLAWENDYAVTAIGFLCASIVISELIAVPILRRRVIPPCIRVREAGQDGIIMIIAALLFIAFVVFLLVTGMTLGYGLITAYMIIIVVLRLFKKTEICGNGLWQNRSLQPWEEFRSFSWTGKTEDGAELRLDPSLTVLSETRLLVSPEEREAVQQILEANLPDQSSGAEDRNT